MNLQEAEDRILGNAMSQLLARLAMLVTPVLLTAIVYFGGQYFEGRFAALEAKQTTIANRVDSLATSIDDNTAGDKTTHDRLIVAEQDLKASREDRDRFQKQTLEALNQLQATAMKLSETVAAQNALLQQLQQHEFRR